MNKDEALDLALEALEKSVATCFDRYSHEHVMSRPEHFINQAITAIKQARSAPVQEPDAYMYASIAGPVVLHRMKPMGVATAWCVQAQLENDIKVSKMYPLAHSVTPLYTTPPAAKPAPVQEPVAIALNTGTKQGVKWLKSVEHGMPLYTTPPAQPAPVQEPVALHAMAKRRVFDAIRGAYDLGYNDARSARAVHGDSAPGYKGRDVESDHGGALISALERYTTPPAAAPVQEPVPDYAWSTVADYEKDVGFEVNDAFKMAWGMARTTNALFTQVEKNNG